MLGLILTQIDKYDEGLVILLVGITIVFSSLILLFLFFRFILGYILYSYKLIKNINKENEKKKEIKLEPNEEFTGEIAAVIAASIHMYLNAQHDEENPILTIKQAKKAYSPWSSKIYGTHNRL
jgi:glutaconyl-CoA/methylmalonyl-CoA decarboxylase subunit delta